jgi:hypothetical protein
VLLERPPVNAKVTTVLSSIPAPSDTVESERQQMKHIINIEGNKLQSFLNPVALLTQLIGKLLKLISHFLKCKDAD